VAINLIPACSTPSHQVVDLDAGKLEVKGTINSGTIGINDKKQVVIREERTVQDELRIQEMVNCYRARCLDLKARDFPTLSCPLPNLVALV
jgi:hypothetical protein